MSLDRISNMLSSIKNASMSKKANIEVVHTKECESIAKVMMDKGYLADVKTFKPKGKSYKMLNIELSKDGETFMVNDIKRVSKPGRRIYRKFEDLGKYQEGYGIYVVSTSRGIMDGESAKKKKLGGELICKVH